MNMKISSFKTAIVSAGAGFVLLFSLLLSVSAVAALQSGVFRTTVQCKGCNVIVISLDQVRAKSLPCFGYTQNTAPNLCGLAARSHIFTNAYATASRTHDSHFSMITGLYPSTHTMTLPYASKLPGEVPTLAEIMKQQGYRTYFFGPAGDPHLPLTRGLDRGFDQTFLADDPQSWIQSMEAVATGAGSMNKPAFFFMHTYMAHEPYIPNPEDLKLFYTGKDVPQMTHEQLCKYTYGRLVSSRPDIASYTSGVGGGYCDKLVFYADNNSKNLDDFDDVYSIFNDQYWRQFEILPKKERATYTHALYSAQIHMLDTELGKFFDYLERKKAFQNTSIIIVGDQGDEFFEHDSYSHGWSLYNEVLHVPLIVYVPGSGSGTSNKLISLVDIVPTVLRIVQKKLTATVAGIDIFSRASHAMIIAEHVSDGALALRTDRYTLIRRILNGAFQIELYDIVNDPGEQKNIFRGNTKIVEALLKEYGNVQKTFPKFHSISDPLPTWIDEDNRKRLIESGYF